MRYHSNKPKYIIKSYGHIIRANNIVYNYGTCFENKGKGLIIIQQYCDPISKNTSWGPVENWITCLIFTSSRFQELFDKYSTTKENGFATITMRHALYFLKIKPPKKEKWETAFDRVDI